VDSGSTNDCIRWSVDTNNPYTQNASCYDSDGAGTWSAFGANVDLNFAIYGTTGGTAFIPRYSFFM
jgi:hypothetical protein